MSVKRVLYPCPCCGDDVAAMYDRRTLKVFIIHPRAVLADKSHASHASLILDGHGKDARENSSERPQLYVLADFIQSPPCCTSSSL